MERFYENYTRLVAHENAKEHDQVVTCEQLHDICKLLANHKVPDGSFSDHECVVWELLKEDLDIRF